MLRTRILLVSAFVTALALVLVAPAVAFGAVVNGHTTATSVRAASVIAADIFDSLDATWATAPKLADVTNHTFASQLSNWLLTNDEDWFKVTVTATGTPVTVNVRRLGGQGGSYIDVYGSTGGVCDATSTAFGDFADPNTGSPVLGGYPEGFWISGMAKLYFVAPKPGTYYFRHRPAAAGTGVAGYDRDAIPNAEEQALQYQIHVVVGQADRMAGTTRYGTAVAVTNQMWNAADDPWWWEGPWGSGVILVSGQNSADGLAATAFALRSGMPVLLTPQAGLTTEVKTEIDRLGGGAWWNAHGGVSHRFTVYICGSTSAVSLNVENQVAALKNVTAIKRLEGDDRYETAAAIADEADATKLTSVSLRSANVGAKALPKMAFVINGNKWMDGLAAGPVAAFADAPVLMTGATLLPGVTADWLVDNDVELVHVVGGPSTVSTDVMDAIAALPTTPTVDRIFSGIDRYETAYKLARYGIDTLGMSEDGVTVVSASTPWDALSAGQLTFMTYEPLMLTPPAGPLNSRITQLRNEADGFDAPSYVVGGTGSVGATAYNQLRDGWPTP